MDTAVLSDIAPVVGLSVLRIVLATVAAGLCMRVLLQHGVERSFILGAGQVNKNLFIPSLIFSASAEGITADLLAQCAIVPLITIGFGIVGFVAGQLSARAVCAEQAAPLVSAACAFSNVVGMPLPLLVSLIADLPGIEDRVARGPRLCHSFFSPTPSRRRSCGCAPSLCSRAAPSRETRRTQR